MKNIIKIIGVLCLFLFACKSNSGLTSSGNESSSVTNETSSTEVEAVEEATTPASKTTPSNNGNVKLAPLSPTQKQSMPMKNKTNSGN